YFLIIGKLYSATQLGYYTNAVRIRDMASQSIVAAVQRVTYPVLSSTQEDEKRLKSVFRNMIKTTGFVNFPLMIGGAVVATPLFQLLFGEKWLPSVFYFQLLCIAGMLYPIHALNLNILKVKGRSDLFLLLEIIKKIVVTILIALSLFFNLGIIGLICAAVISSFISLFINMFYSAKEISYSSKEQIRDLMPIFLVSFLMGGIVYFSGFLLQFGVFMNLISQIFFGIVLYVTLSKILKVQELNILIEIILPFIRKIKMIGWKL
ncbi:oligosaccharide flippase family protein, partial [Psychrobacillus sp. FJAT-21963]|uniref:oligosaccharide flippase family protein n=1 Tax=Psychrobacillus sp. FJAT-21963 TaxID=1712028 RepID=UPI000707BC41